MKTKNYMNLNEVKAQYIYDIMEGGLFKYEYVHPSHGGQTQYGRVILIAGDVGYVRHANGKIYTLREPNNLIKNVKAISEEDYKALGLPEISSHIPPDIAAQKPYIN